ncbi:MAG TPA: DHA2 family efflux MFS transporter permease subunit [Chloroflexota bacterium]|nr:DHA2 family efflux MFS transporter permease subunit [Chloroflexota bacterium]
MSDSGRMGLGTAQAGVAHPAGTGTAPVQPQQTARAERAPEAGQPAGDPSYKWKVLLVTGSGIYMSTLSNGIVNVALPVLTREFDASLVLAQWVVLAYILCITGLLLPAGRLADMLGRKEVFLTGFVVFATGAALCGLAPSLEWLIAARVLQGIGGAMVQANSGALVTLAFPRSERGRALGMIGSSVSAGALTGPVIGGIITDYWGWRAAFLAIVLVSVIATPAGLRLLRKSPVNRDQRFDLPGATLFMLAVGSLMLGLNRGPLAGWTSPVVLALFATSVASAVVFLVVEQRVKQPTVDLRLFRNRGFSAAVGAGFLSFLAISATVLLMPFYFQYVLKLPPGQAGFLLAIQSFTMMLLSPISGWLSDHLGSRLMTAVGLSLEVIGLGSIALLTEHENPLWAAARLAVLGLALAIFNSPNSSAMYGSVPPERLGLVGGFQALTRNLGQSIGQTLAGVLWSVGTLAALGGAVAAGSSGMAGAETSSATLAPPEAMMAGFRLAFTWATVVAAGALLVSLFGRPKDAPRDAAAH